MPGSSTASTAQRPIVVIGAGIIGLTTTIALLEKLRAKGTECPVHIIADHLPNDALDANYASTCAGAHHLSFADDNDTRQRRWDRRTFQVMHDEWLKEGESTGLMQLKQTEFFEGTSRHPQIYEEHPEFCIIDHTTIEREVDHAVSFTSLTMTPLTYLNRLLTRIKKLSEGNLRLHRFHLPSLSFLSHPSIKALIGESPPLAVAVCAGIGALTLGGVNDNTVYPTRGQIVKIRAPWIRSGYTEQKGELEGAEGGQRTYIIPRPDGEIILGGTREVGDWLPYPREDTSMDILRRAAKLCPELVPEHSRTSRQLPDGANMAHLSLQEHSSPLEPLVVGSLVGFRPSRKEGTRLERGDDIVLDNGVSSAVVYNYGHGGAGWQSCWGCAEDAADIIIACL